MAAKKTGNNPLDARLSAAELAPALGCDVSYVRKLTGSVFEAVDGPGRTKLFVLGASFKAYCKHLKSELRIGSYQEETALEKLLLLTADRKFRETKLAELKGELHSGELIKQLYTDRVRASRDALLAVANKLAQAG